MIMTAQTELYHCLIKGFSISEAFSMLDTLFDYGYDSVSCSEEGRDNWLVEIIHQAPISIHEVRNLLNIDYSHVIISEKMPATDWLKKSFNNFRPITVGSFYIYGPHLKNKAIPMDKVGIEIAAATAFGTGAHATTSRCLQAIETYLDPCYHSNFLDIGCGSCILSIAAAKLGMRNIVAFDNDAEAVKISKENIAINNVAHCIKVQQNKDCEFSRNKYDFIVSNILASPLIEMCEDIVATLNPNAILVLSGFTEEDDSVEKTYLDFGLSLIHKYNYQGWNTLVYRN